MNNVIRISYFVSLLIFYVFLSVDVVQAQVLDVTEDFSADLIKNTFFADGCFQVIESSISLDGDPISIGYFSNGESALGIEDGIIMSSGKATKAMGPNNSNSTTTLLNSTVDDPDLNQLTTASVQDAALIEFDFIPSSPVVVFSYVFASEEYCQFADNQFNDVFGFFISGPGINGPYSNDAENIALIPGTTDVVAVNTVNHMVNSEYYVPNVKQSEVDNDCPDHPAPVAIDYIEYDGYTTIITASASVQPCETYHIKLGIADVSDNAFDSAVFLAANSFNAGDGVTLSVVVPDSPTNEIEEGCEDAYLVLERVSEDTSFPITIDIAPSDLSTAVEGVDYASLPASMTVPIGEASVEYMIESFADDMLEGTESLIIEYFQDCDCSILEGTAIELSILDVEPLLIDIDDVDLCASAVPIGGIELAPLVNGGKPPYNYQWSVGDGSNETQLVPSSSGSYSLTVTDFCNTTKIVDIDVNIVDQITAQIDTFACAGNNIIVNGLSIAAGNTENFDLTASNGCDSLLTVNVEALTDVEASVDTSSCEGTPLFINGLSVLPGNSLELTLESAAGCDSLVTIFVNPILEINNSAAISVCEGETATFDDTNVPFNIPTDFTYESSAGCDSIVTVVATEMSNVYESVNLTTCQGVAVEFDGTPVPIDTPTDFTYTSSTNCDSIITVTAVEINNVYAEIALSTCEGIPLEVDGTVVPVNTPTDFTYTSSTGCDSIATITVSEISIETSSAEFTTCEGVPYEFDGTIVTVNTPTDFTYTSSTGCDSIATIMVTELSNIYAEIALSTCEGIPLEVDGTVVPVNTPTDFTYTSSTGCDSIATITVSEISIETSSADFTTCEGVPYEFDGTIVAVDTPTDFTYVSSAGCDSIVTITVVETGIVTSTADFTTCEGVPYEFDGTIVAVDTPTDFTYVSSTGCDSIATITVSEVGIVTSTADFTTCEGVPYEFDGTIVAVDTPTDFTYVSSTGCDSIVTITVSEVGIVTSTAEFTTCEGVPYEFEGAELPIDTPTDFTYVSSSGCDSIATITVVETGVVTSSTEFTTCAGVPYEFEGAELPIDTPTDFTYVSSSGCDSIATITVVETGVVTSSTEFTTCEGVPYEFEGAELPIDTPTDFTYVSSSGCDSIATITLVETGVVTSSTEFTTCAGVPYEFEGAELPIDTPTDFTYVSSAGCDSIATITVTEVGIINSSTELSSCEGVPVEVDGIIIPVDTPTDFTYVSSTGCDSIATITVIETAILTSSTEIETCEGVAVEIDETTIPVDTPTDFTYLSSTGCDSIATITVIETEIIYTQADTSACEGSIVSIDGIDLVVDIPTDFTYVSSAGCDSIVTITLSTVESITAVVDTSICENNSVMIGGEEYFPNTSTELNLVSVNGCDSILTITVNELSNYSTTIDTTVCEGDIFTFDGLEILPGETEFFNYTNANNCDSTIVINLSALPNYELTIDTTICGGGSFIFDGVELFPNDNQVFTYENSTACDSIITVNVLGIDLDWNWVVEDVLCYGEENGRIIIDGVNGGNPPYTYSLDGVQFQAVTEFTDLAAGIYTLFIKDMNDCVLEESIVISEPEILEVNAGDDITVETGMSVELFANTNTETNVLYNWSPAIDLDCVDCPSPIFIARETTTYTVNIIDENDCAASDEVTIFVERLKLPTFSIPNAFSPNGDSVNDVFRLIPQSEVVELEFMVYNRWGERIFYSTDVNFGWDGSYQGEEQDMGVYVYYVRAIFVGEQDYEAQGNITLVR